MRSRGLPIDHPTQLSEVADREGFSAMLVIRVTGDELAQGERRRAVARLVGDAEPIDRALRLPVLRNRCADAEFAQGGGEEGVDGVGLFQLDEVARAGDADYGA